jgi:voltage-gated potassium channel Kch
VSEDKSNQNLPVELDWFLVCGLGSLGQHCVTALAEFGVKVIAIEQIIPLSWEIEHLPDLLDSLIIGDCRQNDILNQAKIEQCRAVLIVTNNEQVNVETALAVRQLNPRTRLVVYSGKENLNQLLSQQLGNFIAFDPTELPIAAFVLAALGTEILGFFNLNGQIFQVYQRQIEPGDRWCNRLLSQLETYQRKILAHARGYIPYSQYFSQWNPEDLVLVGDTVVYLETATELHSETYYAYPVSSKRSQKTRSSFLTRLYPQKAIGVFLQLNFRQQIRRVALFYTLIVLLLLIGGTLLFSWYYPGITLFSAFFATAILLLGGYGDLFNELEDIAFIPWWMRLFSLGLTVVGTAFVGVLYALLTEALLSSRFEFNKQRPPLPQQNHVVIVGMGRIGQKVASLLRKFKQSLVGITFDRDFYRQYASEIPLIVGNLEQSLPQANLAQAKSVVIVTDDEIANLEAALMTKNINSSLNLVIRTSGLRLSEHLAELLPEAQILGVYSVAAAAFAGAAFGENIINLFRIGKQTILVTEYHIEANDTLEGLLLADIAYGYAVIPVLYQKLNHTPVFLPSDELRLIVGDLLVVLATIEGLRRIEQGKLNLELKCWRVRIEKALTPDATFQGANAIARITGCSLALARKTMENLPQTLATLLYKQQAQNLVRELKKTLVIAHLID